MTFFQSPILTTEFLLCLLIDIFFLNTMYFQLLFALLPMSYLGKFLQFPYNQINIIVLILFLLLLTSSFHALWLEVKMYISLPFAVLLNF